ncbi:MAG: hypothetical protein WBB31_10930 [Saprospiraceae bacterium]
MAVTPWQEFSPATALTSNYDKIEFILPAILLFYKNSLSTEHGDWV